MKYLLDEWDRIQKDIRNKYLFLFLDYDGTLTPIVETPQKAVISEKVRDLLNNLARSGRCRVAIISGRSLFDIKRKVSLKNIIYVGNHGLEIEGQKISHVNALSFKYRKLLNKIKEKLENRLNSIKGAILEDKGLSLTVHYRLVKRGEVDRVKNIFQEVTNIPLLKRIIKIKPGKKIFEIRPPLEWNKGKAVLWLLARQKFACREKMIVPIYIGDDKTDEDAFSVLKKKGLTIFVGRPCLSSQAKYYLKNTKEVIRLLSEILNLLIKKPCLN